MQNTYIDISRSVELVQKCEMALSQDASHYTCGWHAEVKYLCVNFCEFQNDDTTSDAGIVATSLYDAPGMPKMPTTKNTQTSCRDVACKRSDQERRHTLIRTGVIRGQILWSGIDVHGQPRTCFIEISDTHDGQEDSLFCAISSYITERKVRSP